MLKELAKKIFIRPPDPEAFIHAAYVGDFPYVEKILKRHPQAVGWANEQGRTALHLTHHWSVARALVEAGADIEQCEPDTGIRPLHVAVRCGNENVIKLLLDAGADIHACDAKGLQAVHFAAELYKAGPLKLLADAGADIDAFANGFTPLMLAASIRRDDVVAALLSLGADVTLKSADGRTADQMVRHRTTLNLLAPAKKKNDAIRLASVKEADVQQVMESLTEGSVTTIAVKRPLKLRQRISA